MIEKAFRRLYEALGSQRRMPRGPYCRGGHRQRAQARLSSQGLDGAVFSTNLVNRRLRRSPMITIVRHRCLLALPSRPQNDRSGWSIRLGARVVVALFWLTSVVLTAEAGQRAGQYVTPNDPLIATTESCAAQQDEFNRLAAQAKEPAFACWKRSEDTPLREKRLSSQCTEWWNSKELYACRVAPSCVGLTDTYYWLRNQQDEARPRCIARAAQQRALKDGVENALGTERSADRQFQMDVNKQVRNVGQEILGDDTVQGVVFDHAMAAIGLSNDQVLRQMELAFSTASLNPGGPTAADYSRLTGAISRSDGSATNATRAEDLVDELFEEYKRRHPKSVVTEVSENPWVRALLLAKDMVVLYRDRQEAVRVAKGSGVPMRQTVVTTPPPAPVQQPVPTVTPVPAERPVAATLNSAATLVGYWECHVPPEGFDSFRFRENGTVKFAASDSDGRVTVTGSRVRFEQVEADTTFYQKRVFEFTYEGGRLRGTKTEIPGRLSGGNGSPIVSQYTCARTSQ
jgi:hypothetical protein